MGTRGSLTFVFNGKRISTFNHFDSYPSGLGVAIAVAIINLMQTQNLTLELIRDLFENLKVVEESTPITPEDIKALDEYRYKHKIEETDLMYQTEWHYLTMKCQGSIEKILSSGYIYNCDSNDVIWKYIVDFDKGICTVNCDEISVCISFDQLTPHLMRYLNNHWGEPLCFHA